MANESSAAVAIADPPPVKTDAMNLPTENDVTNPNPYKPAKPAVPKSQWLRPASKAGALDQMAYTFLSVGYLLLLIAIFIGLLFSPFLLWGMLSVLPGTGGVDIFFVVIQIFFTVLYTGVSWATLRTLRIVAKERLDR